MYDFLDKIGLKTALEQIKAKFPSSLPANGGNADYATNAGNAETLSGWGAAPTLNLDNVDLGFIAASGEANSAPNTFWSTVLTVGQSIQSYAAQLAFPWSYEPSQAMKYRVLSNGVWSDWKEISTTPIKKISFPSVATNAGGGGALFSADFGTPITIACTSRGDTQCTPFYYGDGNQWLLLAKDCTTLAPIPAGSYSFDVWYI